MLTLEDEPSRLDPSYLKIQPVTTKRHARAMSMLEYDENQNKGLKRTKVHVSPYEKFRSKSKENEKEGDLPAIFDYKMRKLQKERNFGGL